MSIFWPFGLVFKFGQDIKAGFKILKLMSDPFIEAEYGWDFKTYNLVQDSTS